MPDIEDQVTDVDDEAVAEPEATSSENGGVAKPTTTSTQSVDVEALKAEYEQKLQRAQEDVNRVKSSLQSREAAIQKQAKEDKEQLQKQLREIRMQGMDENQRKQYEASLATEEVQNLQQRLAEAEARNQENAAVINAQQFFVAQGVPLNALKFDEGYDGLVSSGWGYLSQEITKLRQQLADPSSIKKPVKSLKPAPDVVTDKATPRSGNATWSDLRKKYGSDETIYQLVESGQLDPSILPA